MCKVILLGPAWSTASTRRKVRASPRQRHVPISLQHFDLALPHVSISSAASSRNVHTPSSCITADMYAYAGSRSWKLLHSCFQGTSFHGRPASEAMTTLVVSLVGPLIVSPAAPGAGGNVHDEACPNLPRRSLPTGRIAQGRRRHIDSHSHRATRLPLATPGPSLATFVSMDRDCMLCAIGSSKGFELTLEALNIGNSCTVGYCAQLCCRALYTRTPACVSSFLHDRCMILSQGHRLVIQYVTTQCPSLSIWLPPPRPDSTVELLFQGWYSILLCLQPPGSSVGVAFLFHGTCGALRAIHLGSFFNGKELDVS